MATDSRGGRPAAPEERDTVFGPAGAGLVGGYEAWWSAMEKKSKAFKASFKKV